MPFFACQNYTCRQAIKMLFLSADACFPVQSELPFLWKLFKINYKQLQISIRSTILLFIIYLKYLCIHDIKEPMFTLNMNSYISSNVLSLATNSAQIMFFNDFLITTFLIMLF